MPTILTHPAVPLAIAVGLGSGIITPRLLFAGILASILPDLDVITLHLRLPYAHDYGHRGASHSFLFAFLVALLGAAASKCFQSSTLRTIGFLFAAGASHGILDGLTNGGLGIAFFWPFSNDRLFFPIQLIEVSPLSLSRIFSSRFVEVLRLELLWVWLPCLILLLMLRARSIFTRQA